MRDPQRRFAVRLTVGQEEHQVRLAPGVLRAQRGLERSRDVGAPSRADAPDELQRRRPRALHRLRLLEERIDVVIEGGSR